MKSMDDDKLISDAELRSSARLVMASIRFSPKTSIMDETMLH
jgi:hypothetical protein